MSRPRNRSLPTGSASRPGAKRWRRKCDDGETLSDIDLLIVGAVGFRELAPVLREAQQKFGRESNRKRYDFQEFAKRLAVRDHFLSALRERVRPGLLDLRFPRFGMYFSENLCP